MSQVTGVISMVSAKPWEGRNGPITLYSFQIEGDRRYFRTGTTPIAVNEGQAVSFTMTGKGTDVENVTPIDAAAVRQAPAPQGQAPAARASGGRDNYWEKKEQRDINFTQPQITYQASQRDAVSVVEMALAHEAIPFGGATKGKRLDIILAAVDQVTERFYKQRQAAPDFFEQDVMGDA